MTTQCDLSWKARLQHVIYISHLSWSISGRKIFSNHWVEIFPVSSFIIILNVPKDIYLRKSSLYLHSKRLNKMAPSCKCWKIHPSIIMLFLPLYFHSTIFFIFGIWKKRITDHRWTDRRKERPFYRYAKMHQKIL